MARPVAYRAAAIRHLQDAEMLLRATRTDNASHLAGLAAECGLKALVGDALVAPPGNTGPPTLDGYKVGHLPGAWDQLVLRLKLRSRPPAPIAGLVKGGNPFSGWDIEDRYAGTNVVSRQAAAAQVRAARAVVGAL